MVCAASISDFCFEDDPCQASLLSGDGARFVLKVCRIVKEGCRVAINIDPFIYPSANVLQSAAGARAVMGSNMVLADICSDVEGSKRMTLPCELPEDCQCVHETSLLQEISPKAMLEFFIQAAVLMSSYDANLAISSPVTTSHTIVVRLLS